MTDLDIEEAVKRWVASTEASYADGTLERPKYSAVDIKIDEIFKSFTCLEDCYITTEQTQNPALVEYFESNPSLIALLKKGRRRDYPSSHLSFLPMNPISYRCVRLCAETSYLEIAEIIAILFRLAEDNAIERGAIPPSTFKALCADFPDNLSGGLAFLDNNITIMPSLFACLPESLSAWQQFLETGDEMSIKHGPYANVTVQGDNFLMDKLDVTIEEKRDFQTSTHFNRTQLVCALNTVQQDVRDFLIPLRSWAMRYYPEDAEKLVACFTKAFVDRVTAQTSSKFYQLN